MNKYNGLRLADLELIAQCLMGDGHLVKNKVFFLTGGTGFFGKWILNAIAYLNDYKDFEITLYVLSRNPNSFLQENTFFEARNDIKFIQGSVGNLNEIVIDIDFVIHAAGDATKSRYGNSQHGACEEMIEGANSIAAFAQRCGVKKVLYTSSGAVYGDVGPVHKLMREEDYYDNAGRLSEYGISKRKSEHILLESGCFDAVVGRCFTFCGPHLPLNGPYAFGNFADCVIKNNNIVIQGDGTSVRSYMYAADLIVWIFKILLKGRAGQAYNIGSESPISIRELADKFSEIFSLPPPKVVGNSTSGAQFYVPSIDLAGKELGLRIYNDIEQAIRKTVEFYKKD